MDKTRLIFTLACTMAAPLFGQDAGLSSGRTLTGGEVMVKKEKQSVFDEIWDWPTLYKNDDAFFLNELRFVGRFHGDMTMIDSNVGAASDWEIRRLRAGIKARFFHKLELNAEWDISPQFDDESSSRLREAYISWKFSKALKLTVGKQSVDVTLDGGTSSNELLTTERNNLWNNLWLTAEHITGVGLSGKIRNWQYNAGIYAGGNDNESTGNFDNGRFGAVSIGYDFADRLGVKKALLRGDYVYNDHRPADDDVRSYKQVGSLNFQFEQKRWGFSTDVSYGQGQGKQSDAWGVVVMPWYDVTKNLQLVARYTYLHSDGSNGLRLSRYERELAGERGDQYQEVYAGVNYYFYGHKLKLQSGVAYVDMIDEANDGGRYHGWTWTTGVRISW